LRRRKLVTVQLHACAHRLGKAIVNFKTCLAQLGTEIARAPAQAVL